MINATTMNDGDWYFNFSGGSPDNSGRYPVTITGYFGENSGYLSIPSYLSPGRGSYYPKAIQAGVFRNDKFTKITIPYCVKEIGDEAFSGCTKVTQITCDAAVPPTCGYDAFYGIDKSTCKLIVPEESIDAYKEADGWKDFFMASGYKSETNEIVNNINISVENGNIVVTGTGFAVLVEIYTVGGKLIYRGYDTSITMVSGIYIINVNGKRHKIAI